jgi:hypothetical protein
MYLLKSINKTNILLIVIDKFSKYRIFIINKLIDIV